MSGATTVSGWAGSRLSWAAALLAVCCLGACDSGQPDQAPASDPDGWSEQTAPDDGTGDVPPPPMHWSDARTLLADVSAWDAASSADRRAAAEEADTRLAGFTFRHLAWFEAGGARHQIAVFLHTATGMEFSLVPGGRFAMGSPQREAQRPTGPGPLSETPHDVTLTAGFLVARTEVTQAAWQVVMGSAPAAFQGAALPVEQITWDDARSFCEKAGLALPTEAQWEFACRAGTTTAFSPGDDPAVLSGYALLKPNSGGKTHTVGDREPNAFGLHDMHGNVLEWCADTDGEYAETPVTDPLVEREGADRIARGGSWFNLPAYARSAARSSYPAATRASALGVRPVAPLPE